MIRYLPVLIVIASCGPPRQPAVAPRPAATEPACFDPAGYGAIPDDGLNDSPAFQRALDLAAEGGQLCIGPGRWTMTRAKPGTYNRFAALSTHGHGVTIVGAGPATVLELVGDQGAGSVIVISVDPGASDVIIRDLTIDTTAATNTDEQTHAIGTSANCSAALGTCKPISGLAIRRINFVHPSSTDGSRKGDCIRLLGNTPGTAVDGVSITEITDAICARAFVEIQRGVSRVTISGNTTKFCGDQCIDSEPTGDGTARNEDITITGNTFACAAGSQGDADVSLGGVGEPMRRVTMTGNTLCRGVSTYRIADSVISGNTIGGAVQGGTGVVEISNTCTGLTVAGNTIGRSGSAGPLVRATPHSGGICHDMIVRDNTMTQHTVGSGVWLESVSDAVIANNSIQWDGPAPAAFGVYNRSTVAPVTGLQITGNKMTGAIGYAVLLSAAPFAFGTGIVISGNTSSAGIKCLGSAGFATMAISGLTPRFCP